MRNSPDSDNTSIDEAIQALANRLPGEWRIEVRREARYSRGQPDVLLEITAPSGERAAVLVRAKSTLTPRQAGFESRQVTGQAEGIGAQRALVIAPYLSDLARDRIRREGANYLDMTGNAHIVLDRPALVIVTQGANKDPSPPRNGVRSLKGPKASRIVRALCDWKPPVGVRELAGRTGADPGYVSRVLQLLETEDLVQRNKRGTVLEVDWQGLIRRWAQDYGVTKSHRKVTCLAPRGLPHFTGALRSYIGRYALTGSLAVPEEASIVSSRAASCYTDDPERAIDMLELRIAETGANVVLLQPFDRLVYERSRTENGLALVALSQCAADLLTGGGREPAAGEALLSWMAENEDAWRD